MERNENNFYFQIKVKLIKMKVILLLILLSWFLCRRNGKLDILDIKYNRLVMKSQSLFSQNQTLI